MRIGTLFKGIQTTAATSMEDKNDIDNANLVPSDQIKNKE